jgi:hypothetical protein
MQRIILSIALLATSGCSTILGIGDITLIDAGAMHDDAGAMRGDAGAVLEGPMPLRLSDPSAYAIKTTLSYADADALVSVLGASNARSVDNLLTHANRPTMPLCQTDVGGALYPLSSVDPGSYGFCWSMNDPGSVDWIPQGITTTADAAAEHSYDGHEVVVIAWRNDAATSTRITVAPASGHADGAVYRHVLLVAPTTGASFNPIACSAGGALWYGDLLYLACTDSIKIFDWRYIFSAYQEPTNFCGGKVGKILDGATERYCADGMAYFMMQVGQIASPGGNVQFSSISLDRVSSPSQLVVSAYASATGGKLARFDIDRAMQPGNLVASDVYDMPFAFVRGAVTRGDKFWFQSSDDRVATSGGLADNYGTLRVWDASAKRFLGYTSAYGATSISFWPGSATAPGTPHPADVLYTLTDHPGNRAVIAIHRTFFE